MTKNLIFFLLIILLSACQSEPTEEKQKLDEQPTVTFSYEDEEIDSNNIKGCFVDDCSEENAFVERINHSEFTEGLEPPEVKHGDEIKVEINGQEPTEVYYSRNFDEGTTTQDHTLNGNKIEIHGEGTEQYFMVFKWYNENDEFLGALSKAFEIEVIN
ncbi:hypothetical protein [Halobacillus sp. Marseille-P3879]|uniref:hypothetical protein n=1 Tax=Halobacillus sp. Marseille-P3879 TaxID=2045014 RepID=UPI000C7C6055|nr:hypothetical protein [Halobacillus sp. Marseille-P3879]